MSINERIRRIIKGKKMQDQEFAELIGMSKALLSQRLSKNNWSIEELIHLAEMTGYSFCWICEGYGPELESDHFQAIENYMNSLSAAAEPIEKYNNPLKDELIEAQRILIQCLTEKEQVVKELEELKKFGSASREQELNPVKK